MPFKLILHTSNLKVFKFGTILLLCTRISEFSWYFQPNPYPDDEHITYNKGPGFN